MSVFESLVLVGLCVVIYMLFALSQGLEAIATLLKQISSKLNRD